MLKRLRAAHPILYCILAEVLFLGSLFLSSLVLTVALVAAGADFSGLDEYLLSLIQELVGMYPLAFICYSIYSALIFERPDTLLLPAGRILSFLACMAMVGVAEEFLFRGVIAETLLEHFGTSRAGVWKACLLSGVLFGAAHLTNLSSSAPFGVLMQCAFSASLGALFAAIYFRTGNLWVTVFLHGAMDIASMLIGGLYGTTTLSESVSGYDASMLLTVVVYLLPVAFLLRKKKLPEVQLYWGAYTQK